MPKCQSNLFYTTFLPKIQQLFWKIPRQRVALKIKPRIGQLSKTVSEFAGEWSIIPGERRKIIGGWRNFSGEWRKYLAEEKFNLGEEILRKAFNNR